MLLLVHPGQLLERGGAIVRRSQQVAQPLLGAVEQPGAHVVETERERGLLADPALGVLAQLGMDGDRAVHFAATAHEAAERELDFGLVGLGREPREHFGGAVVAVVDQVIEAGEIVDVVTHPARAGRTAAEQECRDSHHQETQEQDFGTDAAQTHAVGPYHGCGASAELTSAAGVASGALPVPPVVRISLGDAAGIENPQARQHANRALRRTSRCGGRGKSRFPRPRVAPGLS